jgi:hypothetical protein
MLRCQDLALSHSKIQGSANVTAGAVAIECCPQTTPIAPGTGSGDGMIWTTLTTITVPANKEIEYSAGSASGTFRARISTPVTGGTVTVLAVHQYLGPFLWELNANGCPRGV